MAEVLRIEADRGRFWVRERLDGVFYTLRGYWNAEDEPTNGGFWSLSIVDLEGNERLSGRAIRTGVNVIEDLGDPELPPGAIVAVDTSGKHLDPGRDDLGSRVQLVYLTAAEVEAAGG